jgi:DNA mismatch repair protein MutS
MKQETPNAKPPLLRQYEELKAEHPDAVVLFRMHDFWEAFGDDAKLVAGELDLTLTERRMHLGDPLPMCGFPVHATQRYARKLVDLGHRVVFAEPEDA